MEIRVNARAGAEFRERLLQGLEEAGMIIRNEAVEQLTDFGGVDSGVLRASITHAVDSGDMSCTVGTNVEYAPYYHEGTGIYAENGRQTPWAYRMANGQYRTTSGQPSKPFLLNAFGNKADEVRSIFENIL